MEWKTIKYNDKYEVSDTGMVRRKETHHIHSGCVDGNGYISVKLIFEKSKQRRYYIHRLVAEHFLGETDIKDKEVNHKDGNKANNKVENLEWVSHRENILHSYQQLQRKKKEKTSKPIPVIVYNQNNIFFGEYTSLSKAAKATNVSVGYIASVLRKGEDKILCGYRFIPKDEGPTTKSPKSVE